MSLFPNNSTAINTPTLPQPEGHTKFDDAFIYLMDEDSDDLQELQELYAGGADGMAHDAPTTTMTTSVDVASDNNPWATEGDAGEVDDLLSAYCSTCGDPDVIYLHSETDWDAEVLNPYSAWNEVMGADGIVDTADASDRVLDAQPFAHQDSPANAVTGMAHAASTTGSVNVASDNNTWATDDVEQFEAYPYHGFGHPSIILFSSESYSGSYSDDPEPFSPVIQLSIADASGEAGDDPWLINNTALDLEDSLSFDFSHLQVHASPSYLASPARTLHPDAQGAAQPRVITPIPFNLDITTDLLDSDAVNPVFLMGCAQEYNAAPHGGYHQ